MSSKMTVALADCAKHHVAIPADQTNRTAAIWKCPYCRIAELEAEVARQAAWEARAVRSMQEASAAVGVECCDLIPEGVEKLKAEVARLKEQVRLLKEDRDQWKARVMEPYDDSYLAECIATLRAVGGLPRYVIVKGEYGCFAVKCDGMDTSKLAIDGAWIAADELEALLKKEGVL